ncbi:MAG TPA: hypothetical protein VGZ22_17165 [Isosphaeraceae bacterium]|nr:hypothetical protein [Isosphaeraceae bacterium]
MNHPVIGELHPTSEGGWKACLSLPAFQPCYERWTSEGKERRDTREEDERNGRFWVHLAPVRPGSDLTRGRPAREEDTAPPTGAQVAAIDYVLKNQESVARELAAALVREAPDVYHWDYLEDSLSEDMILRLATPEGIMQVVELQSLMVNNSGDEECALIGFSFHSELLEPEHGVGVIMHRDRVLVVGTWDELMDLAGPC